MYLSDETIYNVLLELIFIFVAMFVYSQLSSTVLYCTVLYCTVSTLVQTVSNQDQRTKL